MSNSFTQIQIHDVQRVEVIPAHLVWPDSDNTRQVQTIRIRAADGLTIELTLFMDAATNGILFPNLPNAEV